MSKYKNRAQTMLDDESYDKLKALALADKRAVSDYLRILIEAFLEDK